MLVRLAVDLARFIALFVALFATCSDAAISMLFTKGWCYDNPTCTVPSLLHPKQVNYCRCYFTWGSKGFKEAISGACIAYRRRLDEQFEKDVQRNLQGTCDLQNKETGCPECENGVFGEPHIKTWAGEWYDYHGECDLAFLHAPNFAKGIGLDIHVRTKIRYNYSYIQSAAVRIGDEDILEVSGYGMYFLNGVSQASPLTLAGFPVSHSQIDDKQHSYVVDIGDGSHIVIKTLKDIVSIKFEHGEDTMSHFEGSEGLMGSVDTGEMLARDGVTVLDDPNAFGQEWQVRDTEPMLFQARDRAPQYPEKCRLPSPSQSIGRRLGESAISKGAAEEACKNWGDDSKDACVYDVMATNDLELAAAGGY